MPLLKIPAHNHTRPDNTAVRIEGGTVYNAGPNSVQWTDNPAAKPSDDPATWIAAGQSATVGRGYLIGRGKAQVVIR